MSLEMMQQQIRARLIGVFLLASCLFAVAAYSQPIFVGRVTLPYEVHWNHAVLPPGEYVIEMNTMNGLPTIVRSARSKVPMYTSVPRLANSEKGGAFLTITIQGNEARVRSLNAPGLGKSLIFDPLTKTEREEFAKAGQISAVPVVIAGK